MRRKEKQDAIRIRKRSEKTYILLTEQEYEEMGKEDIAEAYRFRDIDWENCTGVNYAGQRIRIL